MMKNGSFPVLFSIVFAVAFHAAQAADSVSVDLSPEQGAELAALMPKIGCPVSFRSGRTSAKCTKLSCEKTMSGAYAVPQFTYACVLAGVNPLAPVPLTLSYETARTIVESLFVGGCAREEEKNAQGTVLRSSVRVSGFSVSFASEHPEQVDVQVKCQ